MVKTHLDRSAKVTITLPFRMIETMDYTRKDVSRSRFVLRILEKNLYNGDEL